MGNECESCGNAEDNSRVRDQLLTVVNNMIVEQTPDQSITSEKLLQSITKPLNNHTVEEKGMIGSIEEIN